MKIISYNLNGIRAAVTKGLYNWLKQEQPDILCIQETKAQPEQIDEVEFKRLGYKCYWFSAQKKGYSGTGIVTQIEPKHVEYGMGIEKYDEEGRVIRADFDGFSVISVYHPSGTSGDERQAFKMQWLEDFTAYVEALRKDFPKLIINGDFNICRLWIDINHPEKHEDVSDSCPRSANGSNGLWIWATWIASANFATKTSNIRGGRTVEAAIRKTSAGASTTIW